MTQVELQKQANEPAMDHHPGVRKWQDYFTFNTDHKVIGIQYLVTSFIFFFVGGILASAIRWELKTPAPDFVDPETYNRLFTMHGTIMIFLWVVPAGTGAFANYLVPLMIGAKDMAFPRLNAVAFWMIPVGGLLLLSSFFVGPAEAGWTSYPPLSLVASKWGEAIWILSLLTLGTSSILGGLNVGVTIWKMRIPGMGFNQMPLFCWSMLATTGLQLLATPVLAAALLLLSFDLLAGTTFLTLAVGGPGGLPAYVLVLLSPRCLYHGLALLWGDLRSVTCAFPQADFWVSRDRLL